MRRGAARAVIGAHGPGYFKTRSSEWVRRRSEGARQASEGRGGRWELAVLVGGVLEPRVLRQEHDLHGAGGAVALLADDDLGEVLLLRRHVLAVHARAIEEKNDVGVLLERARVVADDPIREPGLGARHREVEDVLVACRLVRDEAVPLDVGSIRLTVA